MAVLPENKALFDRIVNARIKQITPADLDAIYKLMSNSDKQALIDAAINNTVNFNLFLKEKFKALSVIYATTKVESIQATGKIDLSDVKDLF